MRSLLALQPLWRVFQYLERPPNLLLVVPPFRLFASSSCVQPEDVSSEVERSGWPSTHTKPVAATKVRCRARVAYDGANFAGFQVQHHRPTGPFVVAVAVAVSVENNQQSPPPPPPSSSPRTVQGELELALSKRFCRYVPDQKVRVVGAGRTDAGVHARGQAIHFDVFVSKDKINCGDDDDPKSILRNDTEDNQRAVEKMLPNDIALWNLQVAPDKKLTKEIHGTKIDFEWSAMYDASSKWYSYRIHTGRVMDPLERYTRWHPDRVHTWFDEAQFRRLVEAFEGTHDFRAFANGMDRLDAARRNFVLRQRQQERDDSIEEEAPRDDLEIKEEDEFSVDTVRTVRSAKLVLEKQDCYRIDFHLEGALYKQIRNMVGTVVKVCQGATRAKRILTEEEFYALLSNPTDRSSNPAMPAPPQGLTLEHVYFEDEDSSF